MTDENTLGRQSLQIIEIDQDFCTRTYGTAPCTAAVGATGSIKCFNTRKTCQDTANYLAGTQTLRFTKAQENLPKDIYLIPSLVSVSTSPTVLNTASGSKDQKPLGIRATLTATFIDHPHNDRVVDPYRDSRGYDPIETGTFWTKWLARNPYYQNRVIRLKEGYVGQDLGDMVTRTYLIDSINGPDSGGKVTLKAKDVLNLADDDKAQAPAPSVGELIEAELAAETTLRVTGATASEYPAPGVVRINSELITYTGVSTISGTEINLTGCVRGTNGTTAADHSSEDRVQWCLEYASVNAVDVAEDLLTTYAGVDASYIPSVDWGTERDTWLAPFTVSTIISEPTGVTKLLGELTEQCLFSIWWNERDAEIKLRAVRPVTETPTELTDEAQIIAGSAQIIREPKERKTQVWTFFLQKDLTEGLDEEKNYRRVRIRADLEREGADLYGESRIKKIYSRWLQTDAQVINLNSRTLARYRDTPQYMTVEVDAKDRALWTGDVVEVQHRNVVDVTGEQIRQIYQIISAEEVAAGHKVKYKLLRYEFIGNAALWAANSQADYTASTESEQQTYLYWSDENGLMSTGEAGPSWQ